MDAKAMYLKLMKIREFLSRVIDVVAVLQRVAVEDNNKILVRDTIDARDSISDIMDDLTPYIENLRKQLGTIVIPVEHSTDKPVVIVKLPILSSNTKH